MVSHRSESSPFAMRNGDNGSVRCRRGTVCQRNGAGAVGACVDSDAGGRTGTLSAETALVILREREQKVYRSRGSKRRSKTDNGRNGLSSR